YQQLQAGGMNLYGRQPLPDPPDMTMPQAAPQNTPQQQPAITPEMRATLNQFYADAQQQQQQRKQRAQAAPRPQSFGQTLGQPLPPRFGMRRLDGPPQSFAQTFGQTLGQTLGDIGRGLGRGLVAGYGSGFTAAGGLSQMA